MRLLLLIFLVLGTSISNSNANNAQKPPDSTFRKRLQTLEELEETETASASSTSSEEVEHRQKLANSTMQQRSKLIDVLMFDYNPQVFPSGYLEDNVEVLFGLSLMHVIDMDIRNQILVASAQLHLEWTDIRLKWDTKQYPGIHQLCIAGSRIWRPAMLLFNSGDEGFDSVRQCSNALVNSIGRVKFNPPAILKPICAIDLTNFPFDYQICSFKFSDSGIGYINAIYDFYMNRPEIMLSDYKRNPHWDIVNVTAYKSARYRSWYPNPTADITFTLILRRNPSPFISTLVAPMFLLAIAVPITYLIPIESKERFICAFSVFLACPAVLRYWISIELPDLSRNTWSALGKYAMLINVLGTVVLLQSVVQMCIYKRKLRRFERLRQQERMLQSTSGKVVNSGDHTSDLYTIQENPLYNSGSPNWVDIFFFLASYIVIFGVGIGFGYQMEWFHDKRQHV